MKRSLIFFALVLFLSGCKSMPHPIEGMQGESTQPFATKAPNGEASPFDN